MKSRGSCFNASCGNQRLNCKGIALQIWSGRAHLIAERPYRKRGFSSVSRRSQIGQRGFAGQLYFVFHKWRCFSLFLLAFVVGCNLKPTYERPEMELQPCWRFAPENNAAYADIAWWEQFQDPILTELIQTALRNNQDLKLATARILEFYAKYRVASAKLFPTVVAFGSDDRIKLSEDIDFQPLLPGVPRINDLYELFLNFSYEIDFWGKIRNLSESAKAEYLGKIDARRNVVLSLVSTVAKTYIQLKQYDSQYEMAKLTLGLRLDSLDIANKRYEAGLISLMEAKQAETEAEAAAIQTKNFEILIAQTEDLISVLLGTAPGPVVRGLLLTELKTPPCIPAGLPSNLLENRPDIREAEQRMLAANAQVGVARALFFPSISLTGLFGQRSTSLQNFFSESANLFSLGVDALQPIFTGGELTYELKEAQAIAVEAVHLYQQTILTALKEVEDALIEHQKANEKLEIQKKQVACLEEYLKLARLRYDNGQNDYLTVLDAEKKLFDAQLSETTTQGDVFLSLVDLYKALGQGWKVDENRNG